MNLPSPRVIAFSACLLLCTCSVYEKIPNVQFRGPTLQAVQSNINLKQLKIDLGLRFLFVNPLKKAIVVPDHSFVMKLNGQELPGQLQKKSSFQVPAEGERLETYIYTFDLSPDGILQGLNVLGKDNYYEFIAEVEVDLKDFGIKIPTALGKLPLRKHKLEFEFGDSIRLPLPPIVEVAGAPGRINFLGQMEQFDLEPVKNAMTPMVDLLLDAEFDAGQIDPFVNLLLTAMVDVYAPTALQPFRTIKVNLGDHMVNTLLAPLFPQAPQQWEDFKEKMNPGVVNVMDHLVNVFLAPINGQAPTHWTQFKLKWEDFKERPLNFQYPGPRVTGLRVEMPYRIFNPNAFPIRSPTLFGAATEGNRQPLSFQAAPSQGAQLIPPNARSDMLVMFTLDWSQAGQGLLGILQGHTFQPRLIGRASVDLGYGVMNFDIDLPVSLQALLNP
jgi:hypothetical protein